MLLLRGIGLTRAETLLDIVGDHRLEIRRKIRPPQGCSLLAIDEHGSGRALAGAGQGNADIGVFGFARPVDDAAHNGELQFLKAGIGLAPLRRALAQLGFHILRQFLEHGGGGAPAARAGDHHGHE